MFHFTQCLLAMSFLLWATSLAVAHPGHSHALDSRGTETVVDRPASDSSARFWTSGTGASRERGSFVMAREGMVQIRREDDSLIMLPVGSLQSDDQKWIERRLVEIRRASEIDGQLFPSVEASRFRFDPADRDIRDVLLALIESQTQESAVIGRDPPEIARAFEAFVNLKSIRTRWDDRWFYVESNGIPAHQMMVGIKSWQQQVPIPQKYFGENAWQIPRHPVPAKNPQSTKGNFLRGAIAVAVNGIPIFNPLNNRGDDAYLFGELDEFGGHCGRADDYHYHLAPVHLEQTTGKGKPIAYALDGYPIYGYEEPDGTAVTGLDAFHGHKDANGRYHYHASQKYPYLNGGFYGEVTERGGQVDPQPRAEPIRPDLRPLRDARITDFQEIKPGSFVLTYDVKGKKGTVSYTLAEDGSAKFVFVDAGGKTTSETYSPQRRRPDGRNRRQSPNDESPPPGRRRPPREDRPPQRDRPAESAAATRRPDTNRPQLTVSSPSVSAKGLLSIDCTCDGEGLSPAVEWKDAPQGILRPQPLAYGSGSGKVVLGCLQHCGQRWETAAELAIDRHARPQ